MEFIFLLFLFLLLDILNTILYDNLFLEIYIAGLLIFFGVIGKIISKSGREFMGINFGSISFHGLFEVVFFILMRIITFIINILARLKFFIFRLVIRVIVVVIIVTIYII